MPGRNRSWTSLWVSLLERAVDAGIEAQKERHKELSSSCASIVLARTSWEAFSNELIEQRQLPARLKNLNARRKISGIHAALQQQPVSFTLDPVWRDFMLVNSIRNLIIHQEIKSDSPSSVITMLSNLELLQLVDPSKPWEPHVFSPPIASWCCIRASSAIVSLEQIEPRQFRPPTTVTQHVSRILQPFKQVKRA